MTEETVKCLKTANLTELQVLRNSAGLHLAFADMYHDMLKRLGDLKYEKNGSPWKSLKEGSYLLNNAYNLVENYKKDISATLNDENIKIIDTTLKRLQFHPDHISGGYTDEAYGGRAKCFVSLGQGTVYYELLHSDLSKDVRTFIDIAKNEIDAPAEKFLRTAHLQLFEKICESMKNNSNNMEVEEAIKNFIDVKNSWVVLVEMDINFKNAHGRRFLHYAINYKNKEILKFLLDNNADVTQVTHKGNTFLHVAALQGDLDIIEILLQYQECIKSIDAKTITAGSTALHVAAEKGFYDVVKSLLKHGAIFNIKNKAGLTPRALTKDKKISDLFKLIENYFEDVENGDFAIIDKLSEIKPEVMQVMKNVRNSKYNRTLIETAKVIATERKILAKKLQNYL